MTGYGGWRPESAGWLFGLSVGQFLAVAVASALPLLALIRQDYAAVLPAAAVTAALVVLVVPAPGGRPIGSWLLAGTVSTAAARVGVSDFRAAPSIDAPAGQPRLPGALARLRFVTGSEVSGAIADRRTAAGADDPLGLVHDPVERTWTAVARVDHPGLALATPEDEAATVAGWSGLLAAVAAEGSAVRRLCLVVGTRPDDGAAADRWATANLDPRSPMLAQRVVADLLATAAAAAICQQAYLCVVVDGARIRREARASGPAVTGAARVVAREVAALAGPLSAAGFTGIRWLTVEQIAATTRSAFDPRGVLRSAPRGGAAGGGDPQDHLPHLPVSQAGPQVTRVRPGAFLHDGAVSVSFAVILPDLPMRLEALSHLLPANRAGQRRSLALVVEPMPAGRADRLVNADIFRAETLAETKQVRRFRVTRRDHRSIEAAQVQEQHIVDGHALVRIAAVLTVTVPDAPDGAESESVMDAVAGVQASARAARLRVRRLWLSQDDAFFTGALPLGVGLRGDRGLRVGP